MFVSESKCVSESKFVSMPAWDAFARAYRFCAAEKFLGRKKSNLAAVCGVGHGLKGRSDGRRVQQSASFVAS